MAKKDSFYFSHDYNAANDYKILFLRQQLGMEGYGIFWYLVEQLAQSNGKLPLKIVPVLAMQMQVTEAKVNGVIYNFDLFVIHDEHFESERLTNHLEIRRGYSDFGKIGAEARWGNRGAIGDANRGANGHPNAKEIKEMKERKGKESGGYLIEKELNGMKLESWEKAKNLLKNDKVYLESLCMNFGCTLDVINTRLEAFLKRLHDTGDWKDVPALKKHLKNSISKHGLSVDTFFEKEGRKTAVIEAPEQINVQDWEKAWNTPTVDENWAGYNGE